jgi:hypothetical protein
MKSRRGTTWKEKWDQKEEGGLERIMEVNMIKVYYKHV